MNPNVPNSSVIASVRVANGLTSSTLRHSVLTSSLVLDPAEEGQDAPLPGGGAKPKGCAKIFAVFHKYPTSFVLGGAFIGVCLGIGLAQWVPTTPEDELSKAVALKWIGLIGDLFLRAIKCIVLPMVFVSVAISIMDMLSLGETGTIVGTTLGLYLFTTFSAAIIGCIVSVIFSKGYNLKDSIYEAVLPEVRIGCNGDLMSLLTTQEDGSVVCTSDGVASNTTFLVDDINGYFAMSPGAAGYAQLSLSDSIYTGVFMQLIDNNMVGMFTKNNFLGVIVLGSVFGVALSRLTKQVPKGVKWDRILLVQLMEELLEVFMMIVIWIVEITPIAVISLISTAIGSEEDISLVMSSIGILLGAVITGVILQFILVYCGLYIFFMRENPLSYYQGMIPVFTMAFASASSAATLPVTISCAVASGKVPESVARFVLPLGGTVNMDGGTIYIICATVWLAYYNGVVPTAANYILLVICAVFGSIGTAPVPSSLIVLFITTYSTVFGTDPMGLSYIVAIDWLLDRVTTVFNVCGDVSVACIVANQMKKDLARKEHNGEDAETLKSYPGNQQGDYDAKATVHDSVKEYDDFEEKYIGRT